MTLLPSGLTWSRVSYVGRAFLPSILNTHNQSSIPPSVRFTVIYLMSPSGRCRIRKREKFTTGSTTISSFASTKVSCRPTLNGRTTRSVTSSQRPMWSILTFSKGNWRRGPATIIYHPFDPLPSGDLSTTDVVGVPLQPEQTPNQERTPDEVKSEPEDKTPEKVLPPTEAETPALVHSVCPTCSCGSRAKN